jgi:hypothetical protein
MRPSATHLATALLAILLPACVSPKFERAWRNAGKQDASAPPLASRAPQAAGKTTARVPVPARWEGRWHSDRRDGGGKLRAVVQQPVDGRVEIFFEAGWHGFTTAYPVSLAAKQNGKGYELSGEHNLRSFVGGGVYHYTGVLGAKALSANYQSDYDRGTFELSPSPVTEPPQGARH